MQKYIIVKSNYLQLAGNYTAQNNILQNPLCITDEKCIFETIEECESKNEWKTIYHHLYDLLLNIVSRRITLNNNIIKNIQDLCSTLIKKLTIVYSHDRIINLNIRFIMNIISILIGDDIDSKIGEVINFNSNKNFDEKTFYYLEDAYESDLKTFFTEYDNLVTSKHSMFFYRTNLVNISILLKCFAMNCISKGEIDKTFYGELRRQLNEKKNT